MQVRVGTGTPCLADVWVGDDCVAGLRIADGAAEHEATRPHAEGRVGRIRGVGPADLGPRCHAPVLLRLVVVKTARQTGGKGIERTQQRDTATVHKKPSVGHQQRPGQLQRWAVSASAPHRCVADTITTCAPVSRNAHESPTFATMSSKPHTAATVAVQPDIDSGGSWVGRAMVRVR